MNSSRIKANYVKYVLNFINPGGTSRGVLHQKETYFLRLSSEGRTGLGECALFKGLSVDDRPDYEEKLTWLCNNINLNKEELMVSLVEFPSIQFGLEQAFLSLKQNDVFELFPSSFSKGLDHININGLIWMGTEEFMHHQIVNKLNSGFNTIKMKIGAIDFDTELKLLKGIRKRFSADKITIRVDANGAFSPDEALSKLDELAEFDIHSIEQPIRAGQWKDLANLVEKSPIPIALDEELIGIFEDENKKELLDRVNPHYLIFKPSLIGGISACDRWIDLCKSRGIGWWITSALESNVGLNAIAQYTYTLNNSLPQGLGTGGLFSNNLDSPLKVENGRLILDQNLSWGNWKELFKLNA